jgi:hypothetical protein
MDESLGALSAEVPQLPAEVLATLLDSVPKITGEARRLIGPMVEHRDELRIELLKREWIEDIADEPASKSIAAVDGAAAQESLYAGDLVVALAVAAEGLTPTGLFDVSCPVHSAWSRFLVHDFDLDRLGKVAMVAQELHLLRQLGHDMCILDGSHQTPVIVLNSALTSHSPEVRGLAVEICEEFKVRETLAHLCHPDSGASVVACPKSDSSRDLACYFEETFKDEFKLRLPAADKVLAALILEPGEMFKAVRVPRSWAKLHVTVERIDDPAAKAMARDLDKAIDPLRARSVRVTYAKPVSCTTAVKIEFKEHLGADWRREVASVVAAETPGPHLQEPYCQHLADLWAKSAGLGMKAQLQGVRLDLAEGDDNSYLEYMLRSYRTVGG